MHACMSAHEGEYHTLFDATLGNHSINKSDFWKCENIYIRMTVQNVSYTLHYSMVKHRYLNYGSSIIYGLIME